MIGRTALAFVNHLLLAEGWAQARLKPFAGQHARFEIGAFAFAIVVAGDGSLQMAPAAVDAQVSIRLPDDAPLRLLTDRQGILQAARIAGSADFAEALGFVARNLSWDVEADLARVVGDVPAHRLTRAARALAGGQRTAAQRLAANVAEFAAHEANLLVRAEQLAAFASETDCLRNDLSRLEQRIARL